MKFSIHFLAAGALLFMATILLMQMGCSSVSGKPSAKTSEQARIRQLESELKKRQSQLEDLKERNSVLEQRIKRQPALEVQDQTTVPVAFEPSAAFAPRETKDEAISLAEGPPTVTKSKAAANMPKALPPYLKRGATVAEPAPASPSTGSQQSGEQLLYSKILETYRNHKATELQKTLQLLLKTYPDSVYADNALYTAGLLAFESGDLLHAEYYMERVLTDYPKTNKAVSALFAKAMIEKRKGQNSEARSLLKEVRALYPGSPEAAQAGLEAKILEHAPNVSRRDG